MTSTQAADMLPGGRADDPRRIPRAGWVQILRRSWSEAQRDQIPLLAAGVAFYAFLAIFPAMIATILLYGLFADPSTIADHVDSAGSALPGQVRELVVEQLRSLSSSHPAGAGIGVALALVLALWSASGGVANLTTAISTAYDETEKRGFVRKRLLALALTVGAVAFMLLMLGAVAVLPVVLDVVFPGSAVRVLLEIARWLLVALLVTAALAVLYRVAPDRAAARIRWVTVGAALATVIWLLASAGFSIYVANFGSYAKTYGALASVVVLLFWLWITAYAVLLGAEVNAEAERQTTVDTTTGPAKPMGSRGAVVADTLPSDVVPEDASDPPQSSAEAGTPASGQHEGAVMTSAESHDPGTAEAENAGTSAGAAIPAESRRAADSSRSIAALIKQVSEDSSHLVRSEIQLAQAELAGKARRAGVAGAAFVGAAVLAVLGLGCLVAAAVLGLSTVLPGWLAALAVAILVVGLAVVAALLGRSRWQAAAPPVPTDALESVKTDLSTIKESARR